MIQKLKIISLPANAQAGEITYGEVELAVNKLKLNKNSGNDQITGEMLKAGGTVIIQELTDLCNQAWRENSIPTEWGKSVLIPLPKKGDIRECEKYRTISLMSHTGKAL